MSEIYWIYILDNTGGTVFKHETISQVSLSNSGSLLSNFLKNLQFIAMNLRKDEVRGVEMGNHKYFITKENLTQFLFIIKTERDADAVYIRLILNQIKQRFLEKFEGHMTLAVDEKIEILTSFKEDVIDIVNPDNNSKEYSKSFQES